MELHSAALDNLVNSALRVRENAYAPYSGFQVGAAVLTEAGEVYAACNVENASLGLTTCAERAAVCVAVAAGARRLIAVAVATTGRSSPCGACRQVLAEFGPDLQVVLADAENPSARRVTTLRKLLPEQFRLAQDE